VKVTADPAFLIRPDHSTEIGREPRRVVFCIRHLSDNHPGINLHYLLPVSVRKRFGVGWKPPVERQRRFVHAVARGVRVCAQELDATIYLLALWPGRDDGILTAVEQEAVRIGVPQDCIRRASVGNTPAEVAGFVGSVDLLVSMRLHALIFGARQAVPALALSYARKVRGLMRKLEAERWVVEVETRNPPPEEVEMKLRLLWQMRGEEVERLKVAGRAAVAQAEKDADDIAALLRSQ
jgi:polysaccharide pyruvyl transferase WcaK-like protein